MTHAERQAMREKHAETPCDCKINCGMTYCAVCRAESGIGYSLRYPCDVIKELDVLDQIAAWVDPYGGMDVYGAIARIQDLLLGPTEFDKTMLELNEISKEMGLPE